MSQPLPQYSLQQLQRFSRICTAQGRFKDAENWDKRAKRGIEAQENALVAKIRTRYASMTDSKELRGQVEKELARRLKNDPYALMEPFPVKVMQQKDEYVRRRQRPNMYQGVHIAQ